VASGGLTLFAGSPGDTWVFAAHDALGIGILLLLAVKLRRVGARVFTPARRDRRTIYGVVGTVLAVAALVSGLLWANGVTPDVAASFSGNGFPTTSWVADNPRPVDLATYRLRIEGLVGHRLAIALADLPLVDELVATLDCTGGFYSTQRWRGVRLSRILELAH